MPGTINNFNTGFSQITVAAVSSGIRSQNKTDVAVNAIVGVCHKAGIKYELEELRADQEDYTNFEESVISTAFNALETGQLSLAMPANSLNFSAVIPGTFPVRSRLMPVISE